MLLVKIKHLLVAFMVYSDVLNVNIDSSVFI
jgi:hypothetical protein